MYCFKHSYTMEGINKSDTRNKNKDKPTRGNDIRRAKSLKMKLTSK